MIETIVGLIIVIVGYASLLLLALRGERTYRFVRMPGAGVLSYIPRNALKTGRLIIRFLRKIGRAVLIGRPSGDNEVYYSGVKGVCGSDRCPECSWFQNCGYTGHDLALYSKRQRDIIFELEIFGVVSAVRMRLGMPVARHSYVIRPDSE